MSHCAVHSIKARNLILICGGIPHFLCVSFAVLLLEKRGVRAFTLQFQRVPFPPVRENPAKNGGEEKAHYTRTEETTERPHHCHPLIFFPNLFISILHRPQTIRAFTRREKVIWAQACREEVGGSESGEEKQQI